MKCHQRSAEATVNEDRALMRFELLEALLRVAITMRDNEGQEEMSPAEKVRASDTRCVPTSYVCHALLSARAVPHLHTVRDGLDKPKHLLGSKYSHRFFCGMPVGVVFRSQVQPI